MRGRRGVALAVAALLLVAGCKPTTPTASPSSAARPFTVMTTDKILTADPAGVTDQASEMLTLNVFQTLMTTEPGSNSPKPDAAKDCAFVESDKIYTCTLRDGLRFQNGHELTSSDVKFSIQRALRLDVPGSSADLLSAIRTIETPDPVTVKFVLSRVDHDIGLELASPAAAIVDEDVYSPDSLRPNDEPIVGSGPFQVSSFTSAELQLARYADYKGKHEAQLDGLVIRTVKDSATIEEAMQKHQVDLVWRGLSQAALTRFSQQIGSGTQTADGYGRLLLPGARIRQLEWTPNSKHRSDTALRLAILGALQEDRTAESLVPSRVSGYVPAFKAGGSGTVKITWDTRVTLTLGYDPTMPDGLDQASLIRTRLEAAGGLSVRLVATDGAGSPATDLRLVDRKAWTDTALAWLQPYLDAPASDSATEVTGWATEASETDDPVRQAALLKLLQERAATDAVILPLSQSDEPVFFAQGVTVPTTSFGPAWQLGLWGVKRG